MRDKGQMLFMIFIQNIEKEMNVWTKEKANKMKLFGFHFKRRKLFH